MFGIAALVLGFDGFRQYLAATNHPASVWDLLYLDMQLFPLQSGAVSGPLPWQLEVARLLAPAVTGAAALQAAAVLFHDKMQLVRAGIMRDHTVVCGLGDKGFRLARGLAQRGDKVVVVEKDSGNRSVRLCRDLGIPVLIGDASEPDSLRRAGLARARHLVSLCSDDASNAGIVARVASIGRHRRCGPLTAIAHVVDPTLSRLLRQWHLETDTLTTVRLDFFNVFEAGARALLADHPPYGAEDEEAGARPPHVVVVGLGGLGRSLVRVLSRQWQDDHSESTRTLRVTVVDGDQSLEAGPSGALGCELVSISVRLDSPDLSRAEPFGGTVSTPPPTSVYVCPEDGQLALSASLRLARQVGVHGIPVIACVRRDMGEGAVLGGVGGRNGGFETPRVFSLIDRACEPDTVLGGTYEILARAMHAAYVREQQALGWTVGPRRDPEVRTSPVLVPWERLPDGYKESNRDQAAHIGTKLKAAGCVLASLGDCDPRDFVFSVDEIEVLARMEHERWLAERRRSGWQYGPTRDDKRRRTPFMIPWEELSEEVREVDRLLVRGLPGFVARCGYVIIRLTDIIPAVPVG